MALIKCPECNKEISDKVTACPHCGCPIVSLTMPSNDNSNLDSDILLLTKKPKKSPIWLYIVLPVLVFSGYFVYSKFIRPHPVISLCESVIIKRLKAPSSYKPISREMIIIESIAMPVTMRDNTQSVVHKSEASVIIEYESANPFNVKMKGDCLCIMGDFYYQNFGADEILRGRQISSLGKSPFNALNIVKIFMGNEEIEVPTSVLIKHTEPNIFTPHAPGYIVNWIGNGGTDYILRNRLNKEEIQKNIESIKKAKIAKIDNRKR